MDIAKAAVASFQLTAARRRLGRCKKRCLVAEGFNSQPPEGGWASVNSVNSSINSFNSQPPEGGWHFNLL